MTKQTGTIDGNAHPIMSHWLAYNMQDVKLCQRMDEIDQMHWIMELKERWGIFWRIPYWWHHGHRPVSHLTK